MMDDVPLWRPALPLPDGISVVQTLRGGSGWGFNLALHVGAPEAETLTHRQTLLGALPEVTQIQWLHQVHGRDVVRAPADGTSTADAAWTDTPSVACAVMTADCLPVLLWRLDGTTVAAVHVGWRGLADGVIEAALAGLPPSSVGVAAWLGPRIGPLVFEVGAEVRAALRPGHIDADAAFRPAARAGHYLADLGLLARQRLEAAGVPAVYDCEACTVSAPQRWFSYRQSGGGGRMASLIWRHGIARD
jgi:polyphenol oxidase